MLSFKRFFYIVLMVVILGGIFLIYGIHESRPASVPIPGSSAPEREFTKVRQVEEGEKPRVWLLGDSGEERCGRIYSNIQEFCRDLHLEVAGEGRLEVSEVKERDLVIFCDVDIGRYADFNELEGFIAGGGRVILAAGLGEGETDSSLWQAFGILEKSGGKDCHELAFERPFLPVQPEQAYYDGSSGSARLEVDANASVYIREKVDGVPILYTYDWKEGSVCLINGAFLADIRCMGLLSGAMAALVPDFAYPVLGVKAVFLDHFSVATPADDELCRQVYGYSVEGFVRNVVWPAFQGISLRTGTPYTFGILAAASSRERFGTVSDGIFTSVGRAVLQFGGELAYAADCQEDGDIVFDEDFIRRFSMAFPGYAVQGLVMENDNFSQKLLDVPDASIRFVRGMLGSHDTRLSWEDGHTVFPSATRGNSMEDGNLFAICSVLGAYGMVSHVFDGGMLMAGDGDTAAWDSEKRQISVFESEVLDRVPWLEGRTLSQTEDDVRSYQNMDYGWVKNGSRMELHCSGAVKGQAFFYHTDSRITDAKGLSYEYIGNGYYLLRVQENDGMLTLEEGR